MYIVFPLSKVPFYRLLEIICGKREIFPHYIEDNMESTNYTYILKCSDGTLYTGWTNNLDRRLRAHNSGKGAKYTKHRIPVKLVYYEKYADKREAMRREYEIKQLTRKEKELLIENQSADMTDALIKLADLS